MSKTDEHWKRNREQAAKSLEYLAGVAGTATASGSAAGDAAETQRPVVPVVHPGY